MLQCVTVNICNFAIFGPIFMKFAPNCRANELGMLFTIDESKHYITNQYHPEHYGLYPIAGKYSGWQ